MNENLPDLRGFSALLIDNKAERPWKHLQRTAAFSLGTPIPHWVYGLGRIPHLEQRNKV